MCEKQNEKIENEVSEVSSSNKDIVKVDIKKDYNENSNEFNSYSSNYTSTDYFGLDIFNIYSPETISDMIKAPMTNNEALRRLSMRLYSANGLYTQAVDYCTSLPTLDYVVIPRCKNKSKRKEVRQRMSESLRTMHHKEIVRDALFKSMIDGVAFYYAVINNSPIDSKKSLSDYDIENIIEINDFDTNISILPLPTNYTKIVGRKNSSYVLAFNLEYFKNLTQSERERKLRLYPKEIQEKYAKYEKNEIENNKNWIILDNNKTIVSKVRSKIEEAWGRPMCLGAIEDILYSSYYKNTKRGQLDELNNRIFYQTFPQGKEVGSCSLTKTQQKEQHDKVKQAILTKNKKSSVSFFSVASGTKIDDIKVDTTIFDDKNESRLNDDIGLDLGFMASLLTGSNSGNYSSQANNLQLLMSEIFMWIEPIEVEITKVINKNIIKDSNNKAELYYLPCSVITRKDFTQQMKDLYLQGKGSLTAWIASTGMNSDAYLTLMDMEVDDGFDLKYQPHLTSFTVSSNSQNDIGRPSNDGTIENPNTEKSKTNGSNTVPKPSTN